MHHPYVLQIFGLSKAVADGGLKWYIVTAFAPNGSLDDTIEGLDEIKPMQNMTWATQIAQGMCYLHSCNVLHRDLKPANVLLNKSQEVKHLFTVLAPAQFHHLFAF